MNKFIKAIGGSLIGLFLTLTGNLNAQCTETDSTISPSVCYSYVSPSGKRTWNTSGTYSDTILNFKGCDSVITINLTVLPTPTADFSINDDSQCENTNSFVFNNSSSVGLGKTLTYQWTFPDGNTATTTNVTKPIIKADGTYSVKLVTTSSDGCKDSISKNVSLLAKPLAKIFNTSSDSCLNSLWSFKADDLNAATFYSIRWVFPTITNFTDSFVSYSFTSNGSKTIEARVTNANGCVDTSSINVNVYNNPTSQFSVNTANQCFQGHDFDFSNSSVSNLTNTSLTYTWTFGDATNSAVANPSKTYSDTGNRTVSLIATNVLGCADTSTLAVRVSVNPEALFTVNDTNQCLISHSFDYTNSSISNLTNTALSYLWDFGDTTTNTSANPSKVYATPGRRLVSLVVTNADGCTDTNYLLVAASPNPKPQFSINDDSQCENTNSFVFTNSSSVGLGKTLTYQWTFPDGNTATTTNVTKPIIKADGTYSVKLVSTSSDGCKDSISKNVSLLAKPLAKIFNTSSDSCLNSLWSFKADDLNAATFNSIEWVFPTSTSFTDSLVNYSFTSNGSKTIEARITNVDGCVDTTSINVNVYTNPEAIYSFNDSTQCIDNHRFRLTNTSTFQTGSVNYYWDFGDSSTSTSKNPVKIYDYTGYKNIQLITKDTRGCADTLIQQAFVVPLPTAAFVVNIATQCENHNLFIYEANNTNASNAGSVSSSWDFGNGTNATGDSVAVNYASRTGNTTVVLTATNSYGCLDTSQKQVNILKGPDANFNIDTVLYCIRGNEFGFTDASVAGDGTNDTYIYTWGDIQKDTFNTATRKTHSYGDTGLYSIKLWVRDDNGCYDSISKSTRVHPNPTAKFSQTDSTQCLDANSFAFTQQSVSGSPNSSLTYAWDFADTSSTAASPLIKYATAGSRNIKLMVSNAFSCKDTANSALRVYALPNPAFTINDSMQCENDHQFVFTNASNIGAGEGSLSYAWDLGDGNNSVQTNVSKGYVGFDTLTVKLVVSSSFGCKDSLSKRIEILQKPQTELVRLFSDSCLDSKVKLKAIDREASMPHSVSWLYSNGFSSSDSISETSYTSEGAKSVRLIVGNARGCLDTLNYNFNLYNNPVAGFYAVDSAICFRGNEFEWVDSSDVQYGTAINYVWHFGDGISDTSSSKNSIKHKYADTGMYEVQLQITNSLGCADTTDRKIRVDYHPVTQITKINSDSCLNSDWSFKVADALEPSVTAATWDFPSSTTYTDSIIVHRFAANGTYNIEVEIENKYGCKDTQDFDVRVYTNPVALFATNDTAQCVDVHRFNFTNQSTSSRSLTYAWDFGDTSNATGTNAFKVYTSYGRRTVSLVARDNLGCADTMLESIYVAPYPISNFTINDSVQCENHNLYIYEDASTILAGGGSLSSAWVYGDGTTATGDSVAHNYASTTSYITVMHKSISSYGCRDSSTQIVHVLKGPDANFNIDTVLYCIRGNEFGFTDASVAGDGTNDTYIYTWGDIQKDTFNTATRKTHSYGDTGLYSIKLWVRDDNGCYDSISKSTRVHPNPTAKFSQTDSAQCLDANSFAFTQQSVSGSPNASLTYAWDFADTSSTAASPLIKYATAGSRNIELIVSNAFSCKDTANSALRVYALPNPAFAINDSTQCENDHQFVFTNASNIGAGEGSLSYAWNLGDGNNSVQTNVSKGYVGFDTLTVKLVVSSSFGCMDSLSKRIEILQKPQTQLVRLFSDSCLDSKVKLKAIDREVSMPHSVSWLYSNGFSSSDSISETSYTSEGAKSVRLIVGNARGCLDTLNYNFNLYNNPVAGFYAVDSAICFRGNEFEWVDSSDVQYGTAINYVWHFGDGISDTSSSKNSIKHKYADTGMYEVQLQITNSLGCADTTDRKIRVDYHPVTQITKTNSDSCLNNASSFKVDDLLAASIPNILWTFSDSSTYTDSSVSKKFTANGAQRVETIISNIFGCADTSELNFNLFENPKAAYTIADTFDCLKGNEFNFQSTATTTYGSLNNYNWNFGDQSTAGSGSSTLYSYADSGTYSVRLIVTNTLGCADSVRRLVRVNPNPRAHFNADIYLQCLNRNSTQFTDSSESNLVNVTLQYAWDFGDSTNSALANPSKSFVYYGVKTITAIVTNGESCSDTISRNVEIKPEPIARSMIDNAAQCENDNLFSFTDTTIMPVRGGSHWQRWLVDEKEIGDSVTLQNYTVDSAKTYTLKMIATSEFGCQDSIEKPFRVLPKPQASIDYTSPDSCLSTTAQFTAVNKAGNGIKNANWLFSDSTRATGVKTNKKYSTAGAKWVELILENTNGCFDTTRFEFNIHENPTAAFIVGNYAQCLKGNSFTFFDSSNAVAGSLDSIRWNFADGTIQTASAGANQKYAFQTARSYKIRLTAYNSYACQDSTERTVLVRANPTADFDINSNSQCLNTNAFELTNNSLPNNGNGSMSYSWEFGDSSFSSSRNLTKKYIYDGGKTIRLISSNSDGCSDTIEKLVTVRSMPKADFTINTISQCVNQNAYNYSDVSSIKSGGGTLSRIWNLGDGSVSNQKNITNKTYSTAQNFNIQLITRSNFGCADTLIKTISVIPKPNVSFTVNQDTQCLVNNNYAFNNQTSIVTGGGTLTYLWTYGDGNTSTNTHPGHTFKNFGTYQVKLVAQSQFGCVDSLKRPVKVVANPLVDFSFVNSDKQCNSIDTFVLQNKTNKRNAFSISYVWKFGDGSSSTQTNFNKSYQNAGDFRITLIAENKNGCKDSVSYNAKVYPDPMADFSINRAGQCINNQKFDFTNNTSVAFGGGSLNYQWLYSDTVFATSLQSTKTFDQVKSYSIKLIAASSLGCKDSVSKNITVYPKPVAKFDINDSTQCLTNNVFKLTNNSQVSSGTNSYQWDFGDNTGNSVVSPDKVFTKFGTYTIKLLALTNNSCRDSIAKKVTVHSQPEVLFSRSDTALCRYKNSFTFTNNSSNADGSQLNYRWSYSDGNSDTLTNPRVGFTESGLYLVKLVGRTDFGCLDSQIQSVRVYPQPLPSFTIKSANQCLTNNAYEATNYSTVASEGGTLSYRWEFGNASNSTLKNPTWKYIKDDTFVVKMYVESSLGCKDSLFKSAIVYPQPAVGFTVNKTSQCLGTNSFSLSNSSSVSYGSLKYDWTFGDGGRSVGINPLVKYNSEGNYRVGLYAATNFGCKDSAFVNVTVHPDPQALFSVNDESQCLRSNEFALKNNTLLSAGTFSSDWDFGDANTSVLRDPEHQYVDDGIYVIKLKVTSAESCIDSTYKIIQVYPQPKADFTINDSVQCINDNDFIFENKSKVNFGGLRSFWDFGDVSYSSNGTGRHTYSKTGTFNVSLVSFTAFACSDTLNQKVRITEIPQIAFTLDTAMLCERGNVFAATNNSTYNGIEKIDYEWKSTDGYGIKALNYAHSYAERGLYELKLVGRSTEGCMDSSTQKLTVFPQGESKVVVFDSLQCLFGNDFTFGNESKVDGAAFSLMSWNFGGVFIDTQFRVSPNQFQFGDTGTFKVTLITTTENLCMDTSEALVRVVEMPVALIDHGSLSYCHNEQGFEYIDVSQKEVGYSNKWLFNKQVVSDVDTLHPTFELPGKYGIRLVVYTQFGCTDTINTVAISNAVPKARIGVNNNEQCLETNEFIFSNVSTQFTQPTAFWDLGDGTLGSGNTINQNYWDAGDYEVTLVVENDSLCSDTALINVRVNPTPEATLYMEPSCLNVPIVLESNSDIQFGKVVSYLWNMGDGTNYSDSLPDHQYKNPGRQYVSLEMRSDKGCYAKFMDSIDVYPNPEAGISFLTERPTILQNNVGFLDSSIDAATLEWDFGDGSDLVYDEYEVYHTYQDTGVYNVRLVVASFDGCFDTTNRKIRVWPDYNILLPTAFSPNADGVNDLYHIRGNHHSITTANWQVYTEDGIKVFESNDIEGGWNGRLMNNGEPLPMGNYQLNLVVKDMYGNQSQFNEKIAIIR